jgi:hypothetical protein
MKIEDFLSRLEKVERSASGWKACCPAHGDSNPSLSVSESGGKILVHCHAGCEPQAVVDAMGLKMADLFTDDAGHNSPPPQDQGRDDGGEAERAALGISDDKKDAVERIKAEFSPDVPCVCADADGYCTGPCEGSICCKCASYRPKVSKKKSGGHGKWVCDYDYTDESGNVIYKACRYVHPDGRKDFMIKRPDPESKFGWSFGLKAAGIKRVPYRLKNVVTAAAKHRQIIVVEGEKDVESVEKALGMVATCNVGGALKWGYDWPDDWIKWFDGSSGILIIADNDPKEKLDKKTGKMRPHWRGQKHAWDVRRQLLAAGYGKPIKLMVMPQVDGQANVKDFTDWVEARKAAGLAADREAFAEALKGSGEWPEEWEFDEATLAAAAKDGARAEKSARAAISDKPKDADAQAGGRFGRPVPRAPDAKTQEYLVDFDIGGGKTVKLKLEYGWTPERIFAYTIVVVSKACPNGEIPKGVPVRIKAWSAALWLLMRGSFFWHNDYRDFATCMFLDRDKASCKLMRVMSDEFYAFIGKAAKLEDVDPKKGDLSKILGLVKQISVSEDYAQGVTPGNSWDRRGNAVYISSGDTEMCRIKGGKVEMVQNGTDGVVFLRGKTLAPWKLVKDGVDPFASAKIFTGASFADKNGLMNVRLWVMNLFASHATKPPLLITGGAGSGKTRMAKGIKEILGMRQDGALDLSVQQIEDGDKGLDAFWAAVNDGKLEVFDNFDTKVKWASDTLQNAATDGQTKRRTLYTTFGVSILRANASIILTSNNPIFSTEGNGGLADRLITIPLSLNRSSSQDSELSREIAHNRDRYLTWIARTVAKVLEDSAPVDASINRRHPDYGEFSVKIGRAIGAEKEVVDALGAAEADKALLPLRNDGITKEILAVLQEGGWRWSGTAGELSDRIIKRQGDDGDDKTAQIFSSRRVGKALNRYLRQFSIIFKMAEPRILSGKSIYEFNGLTALGASVVDLVDLEGQTAKSIEGADAHGFSGIGELNPPNPPEGDSRARAGDTSLLEKENMENEIGEYDDLTF